MTRKEYLLQVLSEECNEVGQRVSKALRFGLDEKQSGQDLSNQDRLIQEFNDLIAVMEMLNGEVFLDEIYNDEQQKAKRKKIEKYFDYSVELGIVEQK